MSSPEESHEEVSSEEKKQDSIDQAVSDREEPQERHNAEEAKQESQSSDSEDIDEPTKPTTPIEVIEEAVPEKRPKKKAKENSRAAASLRRVKSLKHASPRVVTGYPKTADEVPDPTRPERTPRVVNPDFIANGTAFPISIVLPKGEPQQVHVTDDFTVAELLEIVADKLNHWQTEVWHLCRKVGKGEGCQMPLRNGGKYETITVTWLDRDKTLGEEGIIKDSQLFYRVRYCKHYYKLVDPVAVNLYFGQINTEVISGWYPTTGSKTAVRLAALQLQAEEGDFSRSTHKPGYFAAEALSSYLPQAVVDRNEADYIQQRIFFYHRRLAGTKKMDAQLAYIEESRNLSTWGATWFEAKLTQHKEESLSRKMILGVCEDGFAVPIKPTESAEEIKQRTMSRRKLIQAARSTSIMQLDTRLDAAELGALHEKISDDNYEFFPFNGTYIEETKSGLYLKKKSEEVRLVVTKKQLNQILALSDDYMHLLTKQGWPGMLEDEIPPKTGDCPDFRLFSWPMDRKEAKKELKKGKTMLELLRDNYVEMAVVAKAQPVSRLLLQIESKLDEKEVLSVLDLRRCKLNDEAYTLISESIGATYKMVHSASDIKFTADLMPSTLLLSHNDLVKPEALGDMCAALRITHLDLRSNNLSAAWVADFAQAVLKCTGMIEINLSDNRIGNDGAIDVVNSLVTLPGLKSVALANVGMENAAVRRSISSISAGSDRGTLRGRPGGPGPEMGKVIATLLDRCPKLERLDISDNVLTARGMDFIVDSLEKNDALMVRLLELNVGNTHISGSVGERLAAFLKKCVQDNRNHLLVLKLHANAFTFPACNLIADIFKNTSTCHITDLDLSFLKMPHDAMASLLSSLETNKTVTQLVLSANDISSKLSKSLKNVIANNMLVKLGLRNCALDKSCVVAVGLALSTNASLLELDLAGNNMEAAACAAGLETALKKNKTLTQLNLAACQLDGDSIDNIASGIQANRTLQILHLDANYVGSRGLRKLAKGLKDNTTIRVVSLMDIDCKYKDGIAFLDDIGPNTGLTTLDMRNNKDLKHQAFVEATARHDAIAVRI